jgi:tetratricopeptide (TPR) repeat protein
MTMILVAALLAVSTVTVMADLVHLKNGGTITADSWEERGEEIVIRQGAGTIIVPRSEVLRIDRTPDQSASPRTLTVQVDATPGIGRANPSRKLEDLPSEEVQSLIDGLKRRLRDEPLKSLERTRRLVALINHLGSRAYRRRDFDGAQARFREALEFDRDDAEAQLGLAATYFAQGRDIYARSTLEQALLDHPKNPGLLLLLGDVYYSQERPEDALDVWERAQAIAPDDAIRNRLEKLRREFEIEETYQRSDAPHFTMKYDGERAGQDLGSEILQYLEEQFTTMVTRFDYYPRQPLVVIVYPQRQFYAATQAEKNVGGLFDGKIRVPIAGLKRLDAEARGVLIHELTHAFVSGKSQGAATRWLHEGLAQHMEGRSTPRSVEAALARKFQSLGGGDSWGQEFSYPSSLSFVEYLIEGEGLFRILEVLEALASGVPLGDAFEDATRYSLKELRQAWGEALVREHLK